MMTIRQEASLTTLLKNLCAAILVGTASLTACAQGQGSSSVASAPVESSRLAAVRVHADWCPNCRALDPKVDAVQQTDAWEGVTFVRIDFTQRDKDAVFAEADALGIGSAVRGYFSSGIKTGLLLLVDIDDQKVVSVIKHKETEAGISDKIRAALAGA